MSEWLDRIESALNANKHATRVLQAGDGTLLVTEDAARLIACRMPGVEGNLFWHLPALETEAGARDVIGGDRLWIAPEVGWFWPSLELAREDPARHARTPAAIDPGYFGIVEDDATSGGRVLLDNRFDLTDVRDGKKLSLYATREFRVIDRPADLPDGLMVASFAITNSLAFVEDHSSDGAVAGCWDILQVPTTPASPGTLICPTTQKIDPVSYYDPFGDKHVQCDEQKVRFFIDGRRRIKMGIPPQFTTGRMGYYRKAESLSTLIIRIFPPQPGEPYCDIPRDAPDDQRLGGDALQAYNDDGNCFEGTTFGEMEYQDPCLIGGKHPRHRASTSVTHILVGPDDAVKQAGRTLLGVTIEPIV